MPASTEAPDWPTVREEALGLVIAAAEQQLMLRLVGSVGIRLHAPHLEHLMERLRPAPKDLDFVCRKQDRSALRTLLEARGYENDRNMLVAMEGQRYLFIHRETGLKLDIFVDQLDFCHRIDLRGCLHRHPVTIPVEQLILHKLQIVELTEGDLIDLGIMLSSFAPGKEGDTGAYSLDRLLAPLAETWGFWRTATGNLDLVRDLAERGSYPVLDEDAQARIAARANALLEAAHAVPKRVPWKLRARLGERMQWWQDVDDREGTY
ncbi:MAG: hypothetical protein WAL83_01435 [Arenicellales bacterium]